MHNKPNALFLFKSKHYSFISRLFLAFCTFLLFLSLPDYAGAYIGPGAGFAVAGSFMVMFTALITAVAVLLTWPVRYVIRSIKFGRIFARSKVKKVVVVGLDGLDYHLTKQWIDEGKLPHFAKLQQQGCFKPLLSTIPPISPVAWSSFQTGANPGKHNIFDFLTRDRATYSAKLSSTDVRGPAKTLRVGRFCIPLGKPDIRLLRKSMPFWKVLGDNGIFSSIIRVPITFPPEKFYGIQLSAMCTPDLRGTQGMFSYYTTDTGIDSEKIGGEFYKVALNRDKICAKLSGPQDPFVVEKKTLSCDFTVALTGEKTADMNIAGKKITLKKNVYSDWVSIKFRASFGLKIQGICRFLLIEVRPVFKLYVTPINIDPDNPAMPISTPAVYATYLAKKQGSFATLGLAEDSWALNEKLISDRDFMEQCLQGDRERESMFFDSLDKISRGLCVCVFDGTDRVQHAFWRQIDPEHPAHGGCYTPTDRSAVQEIYERADALVGKTMQKCSDTDTLLMVISDHGFNAFRYGIDLNRWLEENGYLVVKSDGRGKKHLAGVDWLKTRVFAIGLTGTVLNLKGGEAKGIIDQKEEADALRDEIAEKLLALTDTRRNAKVVKNVYNAWKTYAGPYKNDAPDLIVGYEKWYRASWETAIGQVTDTVFHDNIKAWSGDHCIDQSLVPGVLFCNRSIEDRQVRLMDIGPAILDMFGVPVPHHMDGRPFRIASAVEPMQPEV